MRLSRILGIIKAEVCVIKQRSGVNYYKEHCQILGELDLVRVSRGQLYLKI